MIIILIQLILVTSGYYLSWGGISWIFHDRKLVWNMLIWQQLQLQQLVVTVTSSLSSIISS